MNNLEQYSLDHSLQESDILKKIKKYTFDNEKAPQMISGQIVGSLLSLLIQSNPWNWVYKNIYIST